MIFGAPGHAQTPAPSATPKSEMPRRPVQTPTVAPQKSTAPASVTPARGPRSEPRPAAPSPTPRTESKPPTATPSPRSEVKPTLAKPTPTPDKSAPNNAKGSIRVEASGEMVVISLDLSKAEAFVYNPATGDIQPTSPGVAKTATAPPVPGIGIVVKKNPGGGAAITVPVSNGRGELPARMEAGRYDLTVHIPESSLPGRPATIGGKGVTITFALVQGPGGTVHQKGAGSPKQAGFKTTSTSPAPSATPRNDSASSAATSRIRITANREEMMIFLDLPKPQGFVYNPATGAIKPATGEIAASQGGPVIGIKVGLGKNPPGGVVQINVPTGNGAGELPKDAAPGAYDLIIEIPPAWLPGNASAGSGVMITIGLLKGPEGWLNGAGSPKVAGFKAVPSPAPSPTPRDQSTGGNVQDKQLVTPVKLTFEKPEDYDNFAAGKLKLNLFLKNALSGQTIRLESRQLTEGFRPGSDKKEITINVVIDNLSAPLSEAACVQATPSAENMADEGGVDLTLSYSKCDSAPSERVAGQPIGGIVVKGGKNPGGNLSIAPGGTRIVTKAEAAAVIAGPGVIKINCKGNGPPRAQGF